VLAPDQVLANYGIEHSPALALVGRLFGGALLALGVILWLARDFRDEAAVRAGQSLMSQWLLVIACAPGRGQAPTTTCVLAAAIAGRPRAGDDPRGVACLNDSALSTI
jgi:hypothetical protein